MVTGRGVWCFHGNIADFSCGYVTGYIANISQQELCDYGGNLNRESYTINHQVLGCLFQRTYTIS